MERIVIWKSIAFLLCYLCIIQCDGHFRPKKTIVELLNKDLAHSFPQQLIIVNWCLFPSVPVNKTSFYTRVRNHNNIWKYFKVENHTKCKYGWPGSPEGLDGARERYIPEVHMTEQEYSSKRIFTPNFLYCINGSYTQQFWLGVNYTVPWQERKVCPEKCKSVDTSISIQREKVYNGGRENITITTSLKCNVI